MGNLEQLAQTAYEAYVNAPPQDVESFPSWNSLTENEKSVWRIVVNSIWLKFKA